MNAATEELSNKFITLGDQFKENKITVAEFFREGNSLTNDLWWAEKWEIMDEIMQSALNGLQSAGTWTKDQAQAAHAAIKTWFEDMGQKMSVAWGEFKESVGQKFENFKEAMQKFGDKMSEMWGKAMESLGKLWDEIKIGAHDAFVDVKTGMQNLCTDMSYGAANLGIAVQKGVLAMDDAFQSVKGTVSQAVADKFQENAGKLIVDVHELTGKISALNSMELTNTHGGDDKSMANAQAHKNQRVDELKQEQAKLTETIKSRESFRDTFKGIKDGATQKVQANNAARKDLNVKSGLNTGKRKAEKVDRSGKVKDDQKSSYAKKVRESRSAPSTGKGL